MEEETIDLNIVEGINPIITDIGIAIIILLLGFIIGKIVKIILEKILLELQVDKGLKAIRKKSFSIRKSIPIITSIIVYAAAIIIALNHLGILETVLQGIIALILLIVIGSIILWLSNLIPNIVAGLKLKSRKDFEEGMNIKGKLVEGTIKKIGILKTRIERNEDVLVIPNYTLIKKKSPLGKYTVSKKKPNK